MYIHIYLHHNILPSQFMFFPPAWVTESQTLGILSICNKLLSLSDKPSIKHTLKDYKQIHKQTQTCTPHTQRFSKPTQLSYYWEHLNGNGTGMRNWNADWLGDQLAGWFGEEQNKERKACSIKKRIISRREKRQHGD